MLSMLNATLLTLAEQGCNQLLQQDQATLNQLQSLQGKVIAIEIDNPVFHLCLIPHNEGLQIQQDYAGDADVTLSGSPADFLRLLSSPDKADAMFGKGIQIRGDSALATRFQNILSSAHIDWEEKLGDLIGDLPAHQLAELLRWKGSSYKQAASSLMMNFEEYLKEESGLIPARPEVEGFLEQVDQLRDGADRLEARIGLLQQKLDSQAPAADA
ncbi:ubiquinone biosynthesis accessory factor UbiJ [Marinobacterium jannaschii]|uniref:ubiquinone biosynthesis accessory factor UbiJ n=1 Tax=Marinobacterium jannaschii TaxID=64970 RepID=UPI000688ED04|nr:SCP2 sterol-binding domain-containing protein [Marinobacterium jannaschii]